MEDCASTDGCIDVSYVYGACYKKNALNSPTSLAHVWTAKLQVVEDDTPTATITDAPSTDTATATSTAIATSTDIVCPDSDGSTQVMSTYGTYMIKCGVDYAGGDFMMTDTDTFEECMQTCDSYDECVSIAYVGTSCYLKSELTTAVKVDYVWTAIVKKSAKDAKSFYTVPDRDLEGGSEAFLIDIMTLESPPLATLGPVPPPGVNMGGLKVLTPAPQAQLWYNGGDDAMDDDESGAVTVRLSIDYMYPSIVLEHSIYITDISCGAGSLSGRFTEATPLIHASEEWPAQAPLLLITSAASCGVEGAQNTFWLAETVTFDISAKTFVAPGKAVELADVFTNMDIDFGKIEVEEDPDDGTSSDDDADTCGSPSSDFLDDLPAVSCGANFDKALDEALGFYAAGGADQQVVLASAGLDLSASDDGETLHQTLRKRGFWSWVAKAVTVIAKVVVAVVQKVAEVVVAVVKKAVEVVVTVVKAVVAVSIAVATQVAKLAVFIATGNYSNSLTLPVNMGPPASVLEESPWGDQGFKFYTYSPEKGGEKWEASAAALDKIQGELIGEADPEPGIELWCVECGIRGKVVATGSLSATPLSGLKKGSIAIQGNMYAGVFLGVNAFAQWEKTVRKDLFVKGLPGWSIPGIVSLGPRLILGAQATFSVEAEGQLITGASLNWPDFRATLDFVDSSKSSQSGWTPELTKRFDAHGEITAKAALGLPVTINFGINILNGLIDKGVNLTDIPAITAEASLEVSYVDGEAQFGSDECAGIDWEIALTNELRLDISDHAGFTLNEWSSPALASGCIGIDRSSSGGGVDDTPTTPTLPAEEDTSLKCPAADGTTYTDLNANTYVVKCSTDIPGNDMAASRQTNVDECMNWCGTITGCTGVSFVMDWREDQNNCYAKSLIGSQISTTNTGYSYVVHSAVMNSPFIILSMFYSDRDVSSVATNYIVRGNRLVIDTWGINNWMGDPWGGNAKSISMLYMYGAETRTFVCSYGIGTVVIDANNAPYSQAVPTYGQMYGVYNLQIVGAAYGLSAITDYNAWARMYAGARNSGQFTFSNANFGIDTWPGTVKTGVIWYKDVQTGAFYAMALREGNVGQFAAVRYYRRSLDSPYGNGTTNSSTPIATPLATPLATLLTPISTPLATPASDFAVLSSSTNSTSNSTSTSTFSQVTVSNSTTNGTSFAQLTTTNSTSNSSSSTTLLDSDLTPFTLVDTTNTLQVHPATTGNLFLSILGDSTDISKLLSGEFAGDATTKTIVGDTNNRLLHYYPTTMAATGVSRLRLADWDKLPNGARVISLTPIASGGVSMLMAIDSNGDYFWPFFCGIKGQLNKLFLVRDHETGGAVLEGENMKFTVTGGEAYSCSPLALVAEAI